MVALVYSFPKNTPSSSLRRYRFPYKGERSSARLNLCIHAILGDIRIAHGALTTVEELDVDNLGCHLGTTRSETTLTS
jgi:hypothetical protein